MSEVWRDVQGFEGLYEVSSLGNVRSPRGIVTPYNRHTGNHWDLV